MPDIDNTESGTKTPNTKFKSETLTLRSRLYVSQCSSSSASSDLL